MTTASYQQPTPSMQVQLCSASPSVRIESILRKLVHVLVHSSFDEYFKRGASDRIGDPSRLAAIWLVPRISE
jgi:hypothetical protein